MVKFFFLVACLISAFCGSSTSTSIECGYSTGGGYTVMGQIYHCAVNNNPNILTEDSAHISGISGTHQSLKTNDDVIGFHADSKTIQVFLKGLKTFFKNLKLFSIYHCKLKEIHQSDLKVFPDLIYFYLWGNEIEVIEEGLFDFNPKLEVVGFRESKIVHIDPNVFDNLPKLSHFWFSPVPCVAQHIENSKEKVQQAIKIVKTYCSNSDFLSLDTQIKTLEIESKTLNFAAFNTKLEIFEKSFNASKFFKFRPLNYKFQNFKSIVKFSQVIQVITNKFEGLESAQCGLKSPIANLKSSQNALQTTLSEIKSIVSSHDTNFVQFQVCQSNLTSSQFTMADSIDKIVSGVNKQSVSLGGLMSKINELQGVQKSQNSLIGDVKAAQTVQRSTLDNLKESQNQMSKTLTDMKIKMGSLQTDIKTDIDTKLKSFKTDIISLNEDSLAKSEAKTNQKINEVKKQIEQIHVQLFKSVDAKLNAIEGRLTAKINQVIGALSFD